MALSVNVNVCQSACLSVNKDFGTIQNLDEYKHSHWTIQAKHEVFFIQLKHKNYLFQAENVSLNKLP